MAMVACPFSEEGSLGLHERLPPEAAQEVGEIPDSRYRSRESFVQVIRLRRR
jgi:hypothetical protein